MLFAKHPENPILKPNPQNSWESLCVLNPAVFYKEDEKLFYMIYRAAGNDETHYIYLGLATSKDGIHFTRQSQEPVLSPDKSGADGGGTEDPRIVKIGDYFYMTYASRVFAPGQYWKADHKNYGFAPLCGPSVLLSNNTETHLAISKDLRSWKKLGRITNAKDDDRDVVLFPEAINGKYYRTSRPSYRCGKGYPNPNPAIWLTSSDDLLEWDEPLELLYQGEEDWESFKVGASCPPIKTAKGWVLIYHGVSAKDKAYRVGAFLLDLKDPRKILAKTKKPFLEPTLPYETEGYYNGCVFPTANVVKDGTLYLYYGAADHFIGVATCSFDEFMANLLREGTL
jgi:Predicted glycosylase